MIGSATSVDALNRLVPRITKWSYVEKKQKENADLVEQLTQYNFARSSSKPFDLYARQNFLDNTLRGGLPISLRDDGNTTTIHLYSRKHGDLERDYNDYRLSATNYSQGNGNFRDVNQNRRNDLLINPDVRESNVEHFFNLLQLDGFNPLIVKVTGFTVKNRKALDKVLRKAVPAQEPQDRPGILQPAVRAGPAHVVPQRPPDQAVDGHGRSSWARSSARARSTRKPIRATATGATTGSTTSTCWRTTSRSIPRSSATS